jgi:hypothetical protein
VRNEEVLTYLEAIEERNILPIVVRLRKAK